MNDASIPDAVGLVAVSAVGRRRFLKHAAAAAAAIIGSAAPILGRRTGPETGVVMAVGGAGARIASVVHSGGLNPEIWLWNRAGSAQHVSAGAARRVLLPESVDGFPSWLDREMSRLDPAQVALVAGFGGVAGSYFTPPIAAALGRRGVQVSVLAVLPFRFEGEPRWRAAEHARSVLEQTGVPTQLFFNDSLLAGAQGRTLAAVLDGANAQIAHGIRRHLLG